MRLHIVSVFAAFVATASCITITLPTDGACIDLTKNVLVEWVATRQEVEEIPKVSFRLANYNGAYPNVNEPLPLGVGRVESTRKGFTLLPAISTEDAERFYEMNNGFGLFHTQVASKYRRGFTIRITRSNPHSLHTEDLETEASIVVAKPGHGC